MERRNHHGLGDEKRDPGGSHAPVVFIPKTLEIYYLHCWPCRYTDKGWNTLNLNDYIPMRRFVKK